MTTEEFVEIANLVLSVNWDVAAGLIAAPLFFLLAVYYLVGGDWPWPKKYRAMAQAGVFLLLGCWSAAGCSGISKAFWSLSTALVFFGLVGGCLWLVREWFARLPVAKQVYRLPGVGEVTVKCVEGSIPFDATVTYIDATDQTTTVLGLSFMLKADLLADRRVTKP